MLRISCPPKGGHPDFLKAKAPEEGAKELPDETEVLHIRKDLDGEILPAKVIAEHADYGQSYRKLVKRRLGDNDGELPFWK